MNSSITSVTTFSQTFHFDFGQSVYLSNEFIHFEFDVSNNSDQNRNIRLEYKVAFVKANGSTSNKVFQISELTLKANSSKNFKRKQWFKELSTRKHYPGKHKITLVINGDEKEEISLMLNH